MTPLCGNADGHRLAVAMFAECPACALQQAADQVAAVCASTTLPTPLPDPDGATYRRDLDREPLTSQAGLLWAVLQDQEWHTLAELALRIHAPEASVSARLRDFRKPEWGSHTIQHQRLDGQRQWRYRLVRPRADATP